MSYRSPVFTVNLNESRYSANLAVPQINRARYLARSAAPQPGVDSEALINDIFDMLYTVRCNTLHGGKDTTDDNAIKVVDNAYALVRMIVDGVLIR